MNKVEVKIELQIKLFYITRIYRYQSKETKENYLPWTTSTSFSSVPGLASLSRRIPPVLTGFTVEYLQPSGRLNTYNKNNTTSCVYYKTNN